MKETKEIKKSKYNMWQNTGFMLGIAWKHDKSVIFLCIALAMATAGVTITELLIAPMILQKSRNHGTAGTAGYKHSGIQRGSDGSVGTGKHI